MQVLVVDDDPISLELLAHALGQMGHRVLTAENGVEGLRVLQANPQCRLVISDWEMPEMTGLELCSAIRSGDFAGYIFVILLTLRSAPDERLMGLTAGADEFLSKPFDPDELAVRLINAERILSLETRDVAIFAMAKLAESRDPETGAHLERVRNYCRVLSCHLATLDEFKGVVDREFLRLIYATSPLHDIGKVGVPDHVLLKPGKLTPQEFTIMKTHAAIGAETLSAALEQFPNARFLEMARDIAIAHHEKYDGTGYPNGLTGESIPLCARILAVADVYDALTTKRVYKPAYSHEEARDIILKESGSHFDPRIVAAFSAFERQFVDIAARFREAATPVSAELELAR